MAWVKFVREGIEIEVNAGDPGMPGKWAEILLRRLYYFLHQLLSSGIEEQCKGTDCKKQAAVIKLEKILRRRAEVFLQEELEAGLII